MIVERLILREYNWAVTVLLDCDCSNTSEIIDHLQSIHCPTHLQKEAVQNLESCKQNIGLTYSNFGLRRTIMVISKTSNNKQLINTITHECYHFIQHLQKANHIIEEEELANLTGRFNMCLWDTITMLLQDSN